MGRLERTQRQRRFDGDFRAKAAQEAIREGDCAPSLPKKSGFPRPHVSLSSSSAHRSQGLIRPRATRVSDQSPIHVHLSIVDGCRCGRNSAARGQFPRGARLGEVKRKGSIGSAPHGAPRGSHCFNICLSASVSGCSGGISSAATRCQRRLSSGRLRTIASPLSPPRRAGVLRLRSSSPSAISAL